MIQLIVGGKGSGKTKKMIDMINASAKTTPGNIVCIEKSMKLTYDIDHSARLIDVDEYGIDGYDMLYGFIAGVLAGNYDIVEVYLDGVLKLGHHDLDALGALLPKLAALVSIMPQSVLGGAAVMMFSSIVMSGIQLITREPLTARNMTIVSVALGLGYGLGANTAVLAGLPQAVQLIFGGSGIVPAAFVAILLNVLLPQEKKEENA